MCMPLGSWPLFYVWVNVRVYIRMQLGSWSHILRVCKCIHSGSWSHISIIRKFVCVYMCMQLGSRSDILVHAVATISRLLKIIGDFRRISSLL